MATNQTTNEDLNSNTPVQSGGGTSNELEQSDTSEFAVEMFTQLDNVDFDGADTVEPVEQSPALAPVSASTNPEPLVPGTAPSGEGQLAVSVTPQHTADPVVPAAPVTVPVGTPDANALPVQGTPDNQQSASLEVPQESPIEVFRREVEKNKDVFTKALADTTYKLSDDEALAINSEPDKAVPLLMAKAHVSIVQNVLGTIAQQLPAAISGYLKAEKAQTELEDKFFAQFPQIDRKVDRATVLQFAAAYRAANPKASFEEMSRVVGVQALVALNKFTPQAPQQQAKLVAPGAQAFAPAANGSRAPIAPQPASIWDQISTNLNEDFDS